MGDMSWIELIARLVAGVVLTGLNAFFVTTEFALTRAPQLGKDQFQDSKALRIAWKMTEELEIYLTGCQLGISATSVLLGVVAEPAVTELLRPLVAWLPIGETGLQSTSVVLSVVVIQFVHKIWGEQAPTYLGVERPRQVARFTAPVHYWFTKLSYPIIKAGDGIAKATLRLFGVEVTRSWAEEEAEGDDAPDDASTASPRERVRQALAGAPMPPDRKEEVGRAAEIDHIAVRRIMTPRDEVRALDTTDDVDALIELLHDRTAVRVPLLEGGDLDRCVGVLHTSVVLSRIDDLRLGDCTLAELAHEPLVLDADLPVAAAIDRLQDSRRELAVLESDGRAVGVLTVTDCFESIVGELEDPYD